ncbi:MAG: hypothetical protein KIT84_34270 [Labilithrix sp.]|nr:hypothetical protein [Labilithrix sp.]MCW5816113.1 hypothetical protein [Labilithrix sp.]
MKGLQVGDRLKVTVLDRYDQRSTFRGADEQDYGNCHADYGLGAGSVHIARVNRPAGGMDCVNYLVDWESFGAFKLELVDRGIREAAMVGGAYLTSVPGCSLGSVSLNIVPTFEFPVSLPLRSQPGQYPSALIDGSIDGRFLSGEGCARCPLALVVDVEKL